MHPELSHWPGGRPEAWDLEARKTLGEHRPMTWHSGGPRDQQVQRGTREGGGGTASGGGETGRFGCTVRRGNNIPLLRPSRGIQLYPNIFILICQTCTRENVIVNIYKSI